MTLRTETRYWVICDSCHKEYHAPQAQSALESRVAAGIEGWKYRQQKGGRSGKGTVKQADACPNCELPEVAR